MFDPKTVYTDKDFIAIDKPAGLLVHRTRISDSQFPISKDEPTLVDWLLEHYPEVKNVGDLVQLPDGSYGASDPLRPGIVHRLDRDTSGVMLVPRNQNYFEYLKSLFQKHEIQKIYLAVVFGSVKSDTGIIDKPIGIKSGTTKRSVRSEKMAKIATTEYRTLKRFTKDGESYTLLEVRPKTGRTHQIRVHLASIGHPIVGDVLYTKRNVPVWAGRLMLHALAVEFSPRSGEQLQIETELPLEFKAL